MADGISIASGIAGLVTLSAAVLAAGYKYVSSVSSASQDFRNLIRETASLNAVLSQLVSNSLEDQAEQRLDYHNLPQQDVLQDCEETLRNVQSLIRDCELHPTPDDFFRTMENASGENLNWFWRGWFLNNWRLDVGVRDVKYVNGDASKVH